MLTDLKAKAAKPREKPYGLTDDRGLLLLVKPNGSKLWRFRYVYRGREKMIGMGQYPDTTLKDARDRRDEARRVLAAGIDPSTKRKAEKQAQSNTLEAVATEWLAEGCPGHRTKHLSADTVGQLRHRLKTYVLPEFGRWPITDITAPELLKLLRRIAPRGKRLETAHRVRALCSRVFRYAIQTGRAERDPAQDLKGALAPAKTTSFAAITDPKALGAMLRAIDGYHGQPATRAALQVLALTFVRPGELRQAKWGEFDLDGAQWVVPAGRMKMRREHVVPLSSQAVAILRELAKVTERGPDSYVFPSLRPARPLSDNTLNAALRTLDFGHDTHVAHGFRSTASTLLHGMHDANGQPMFSSQVIEAQLAHTDRNAIRAVYNRSEYLPQRRAMMEHWAGYLDELKKPNENEGIAT
jgi:integrase